MSERSIFLEAADLADPDARRAYLDAACGADAELRSRVEGLLGAHEKAIGFLERPAVLLHSDPAQPTGGSVAEPPPARRSSAKVRVTDSPPQGFVAETTSLLHHRLYWVTLATTIAAALALVTTLDLPFLTPRIAVIAIYLGSLFVLHRARSLSLTQLRVIELLLLGSVAAQMIAMPAALMLQRAEVGDYATVIMDGYFVQAGWTLVIISYGLLIPNTRRRALIVMLPLGLIPYLSNYLLGLYEPKVQAAFDSLHHNTPFPVTLVAVVEALFYVHVLNASRWEVYRARKFGQYRLQEKLGEGGMGEVYRAEHELLKRSCAIKLIRPGIDADPAAIARFEQEVRATAQLSHWNTVEIYDYGRTDDGTFYYVMELLRGLNLDELVRRSGRLPPGRVVYLLTQVCDALREAHDRGLMHRDIKPGNIFSATRGGAFDVAKLLDFGLVRHVAGSEEDEKGVISGSPAYMAPEQALPGEPLDGRCDLYALAGVGYFLLTGHSPFDGDTILGQIAAHRHKPVVPPSERVEGVPADLERVILRCLGKSPEERYPDARALRKALAECECASDWDPEKAARWWGTHLKESQPGETALGPGDAGQSPPTLLTVRLKE